MTIHQTTKGTILRLGSIVSGVLSLACAPLVAQTATVVTPAFGNSTTVPLPPNPSDTDIETAHIFDEPLVPIGGTATKGENAALGAALLKFQQVRSGDDVSMLDAFLEDYPQSRWRVALQTNIAIIRRHAGYFNEAMDRLEDAWKDGQDAATPQGTEVASRALAELADLNARFGRVNRMKDLIAEADARDMHGSSNTMLAGVREGYWRMTNAPWKAFRCGPYAVNAVLCAVNGGPYKANSDVAAVGSTKTGTNLKMVADLAAKVGLDYKPAFRTGEAAWPVPCVIHWKVGHFAAVTQEVGGKYLIQDPTFGSDVWVSDKALDQEATGYALVPASSIGAGGWRAVSDSEARKVWGRGGASGSDQKAKTHCNNLAHGTCGGNGKAPPMAAYDIFLMNATMKISDTPVTYRPPYGPRISCEAVYTDEPPIGTPTTPTYANFGTSWSFNWSAWLDETALVGGGSANSSLSISAIVYPPGGGADQFANFTGDNGGNAALDKVIGQSSRSLYTGAVLLYKGAAGYERELLDGSREIYSRLAMVGTQRRFYLTAYIDPQGNQVSLIYDSTNRLTGIVDATGYSGGTVTSTSANTTTISYMSNTTTDPGYYLIYRITLPGGRYCQFSYSSGELSDIQDPVLIHSTFTYGSNDFISNLHTPYGDTSFYKYTPASGSDYGKGLLVLLPDGSKEDVETYSGHKLTTYYWTRKAMAMSPGNPDMAQQTGWLMSPEGLTMVDVKRWTKNPYEGEVDYTYDDGSATPAYDDPANPTTPTGNHYHVGSTNQPSTISRSTPEGTQTYSYKYNPLGGVTKMVDPLGRTFTFIYATNNIDLMEVRQTRNGANDLLAKYKYNTQHLPTDIYDASGYDTRLTYTSHGQLWTITNPKSETTTLNYRSDGFLDYIDGPLSGANDKVSFTYDPVNIDADRVASVTSYQGPNSTDQYTRQFVYDNIDRVTQITYPDGTTEKTLYKALDLDKTKDRLNRWTTYSFSPMRQISMVRDPAGRTTYFDWCRCGALQKLTDPAGQVTKWAYDEDARLLSKTYADGSQETFDYQPNLARLWHHTDAKGNVTTYAYYLDNSIHDITFAPGTGSSATAGLHYTYDPSYPRLSTVGNDYATYTFNYYPYVSDFYGAASKGRGKLSGITTAVSSTYPSALNVPIAYQYDELGRLVDRQINGTANEVQWAYDAANRLSSWTNPLGTFTPTYQNTDYGVRRVSSLARPFSTAIGYQWENALDDFQLKQIQNQGLSSSVLSQFDYTTDAMHRINTWISRAANTTAQTDTFGYDWSDQLTSGLLTDTGTGAALHQYIYGYDKAGNRTSSQLDSLVNTTQYNNLNQIQNTSAGGATHFKGTLSKPSHVTVNGQAAWMSNGGLAFDGTATLNVGTNSVTIEAADLTAPPKTSTNTRTNTYQVVVPSGASATFGYDGAGNLTSDGVNTYTWDALNRLTKIAYPAGTSSEFTYDAFGRRVRIVEKSGSTVTSDRYYVWDQMKIAEQRDASGTLLRRYYDDGFMDGSTPYLYDKDHLGSIRDVVNSTGMVTASYSYDPYGQQPTGLPSGMQLWLKADAGVTKDGSNKVSAWADQSGNGGNATESTSSIQPTWVTSGLNGQPVLHFDGTDELDGQAGFNSATSDTTIFVVSKRTAMTAWGAPFSFNAGGAKGNPLLTWNNTTNTFGANNSGVTAVGVYVDLSAAPSDAYVHEYRRSGTGLSIRSVGGTLAVESDGTQSWTPTANANGAYFVGRHYTGGNLLNGDVAEVIVYNRALNDDERTRVEAYLAGKYGMPNRGSDFRYTGHYYHAPSGLELAPYRAYSANLGRWLSRDPMDNAELNLGPNLYQYIWNSPVCWIDPYGLCGYADTLGNWGAALGAGTTMVGSVVVDAATGGANILATPGEIGLGGVVGGGVGYGIGSALDWLTNNNEKPENDAVDGGGKSCPAGSLTPTGQTKVEDSTKKGNKGGKSVQEGYKDSQGRPVTKHTIYGPNGNIVSPPHFRPGGFK